MALARLALKNMQNRVRVVVVVVVVASPCSSSLGSLNNTVHEKQRWSYEVPNRFSTINTTGTSGDEKASTEVAVKEGSKKSKLLRHRKRSLWRNKDHDLVPSLNGIGNALLQATENINSLFEKLSRSRLLGRVKEEEECYKLRFPVPGLAKEDVKITVEDGVLRIEGEQKEEVDELVDHKEAEELWYGYYSTTLLLPEDVKVDEVKAEMKDVVLTIIIPRTERQKKDVKEIQIQ